MAFVSTYDVGERRDLDVAKKIALYMPEATPFAVMLMRARKNTTQTAYFSWWDQQLAGWWGTVGTISDSGATETTIPVSDVSIFRAKDIVKVPRTGEVLFVTEVTSSAIKVQRGYGTTPASEINTGDSLMRLGNAMEQFSLAPESKIVQPVKDFNLTQIFRRPFDQSMTSSAESVKTAENERNRLRKEQAIEHRLDIERAMLFGERYEDPTGQRQTTGGLLSFIDGNFIDAQNEMSEEVLEAFCEKLFSWGSTSKLLICSHRTGSIINQFAANRIQTVSGEDTYGLRLKKYQSFHGDLYIVPSRTLEKDYIGHAFGVDMENIEYRPLTGRDTKLKTNIQANDADGWRDEFLTEAGLMVRLPQTHCYLKNCAVAAEPKPHYIVVPEMPQP